MSSSSRTVTTTSCPPSKSTRSTSTFGVGVRGPGSSRIPRPLVPSTTCCATISALKSGTRVKPNFSSSPSRTTPPLVLLKALIVGHKLLPIFPAADLTSTLAESFPAARNERTIASNFCKSIELCQSASESSSLVQVTFSVYRISSSLIHGGRETSPNSFQKQAINSIKNVNKHVKFVISVVSLMISLHSSHSTC